jgi:hypothetical protein
VPPTHTHKLVVIEDFDHPGTGLRHIRSRCLCGLSEKRRYDGKECVRVEYRYDPMGGAWIDADALLQLTVPVKFCPTCYYAESGIDDDCPACHGTGVVDHETGDLPAPPRRKRARR